MDIRMIAMGDRPASETLAARIVLSLGAVKRLGQYFRCLLPPRSMRTVEDISVRQRVAPQGVLQQTDNLWLFRDGCEWHK
jgi:hypothetical protein